MVTIFNALGFSINTDKSLLTPCQELEFLGVTVQSQPPTLHLPQTKLKAIKDRASQLLNRDASHHQTVTVREIAQFIGTANAAAVAIPPAPLFYRSLQTTKHFFQNQEGGWTIQYIFRAPGVELVEGTSQFVECSQLITSNQLDKVNH